LPDSQSRGQLPGVIASEEVRADRAYDASSATGLKAQVREGEAALRHEERQTRDQMCEAEATLASSRAQQAEADAALESGAASTAS
jgi:hypothetical protein